MRWKHSQKHRHRFLVKPLCLLFIISTFLLSSCAQAPEYTSEELLYGIAEAIPESHAFTKASDRYLRSVFAIEIPKETEVACLRNNDNGMDEIGVFKCKTKAEANILQIDLKAALTRRTLAFDDRYFSEEKIKFENAFVVARDRYILYAILSPDRIDAAKDKFVQYFDL